MEEKKTLLQIRDLAVEYRTEDGIVQAVNGIDLDVNAGETVGLVGETGAGKTTVALSILRLIPDPPGQIVRGEIIWKGKDLLKESREMRILKNIIQILKWQRILWRKQV